MSTTQQARDMAHHFNEACRNHRHYQTYEMGGFYANRQKHIAKVAKLTGQSFDAVRYLVEVATQDQSDQMYLATWVGLRPAAEIEAEYREEVQ